MATCEGRGFEVLVMSFMFMNFLFCINCFLIKAPFFCSSLALAAESETSILGRTPACVCMSHEVFHNMILCFSLLIDASVCIFFR